ncbi:Uncharacterised protein [Burkholderia pseudomallei]|nr:Uncharacterised protein [Burkholderia pseudomallei]
MAGDDQWTALAWPWASLEPAPRRACVPSPRYRPRVTERFQFRLIHSTLGDRDGTPADVEALAGFAGTRAIGHGNPRLSRIPHAAGEQHGSTDVRFSRSALVRPFRVHVYRCDPGKQDARAAKTDETIDGRIRSSMIGGACSATMAGYFFRRIPTGRSRVASMHFTAARFAPLWTIASVLDASVASRLRHHVGRRLDASTPRRHRAASTTQSVRPCAPPNPLPRAPDTSSPERRPARARGWRSAPCQHRASRCASRIAMPRTRAASHDACRVDRASNGRRREARARRRANRPFRGVCSTINSARRPASCPSANP